MRRLVFAAPFVVVIGCERSAKREWTPPDPIETVAPATAPRPRPRQLVEALAPLSPAKTFWQMCLRSHCNPPPPGETRETGPLEPTLVRVTAVQREPDGARVRVERKPLMNERWRGVFVDRLHIDLHDGACEITDWDYHELECKTQLRVEDLVDEDGATLRVRVIPPAPK